MASGGAPGRATPAGTVMMSGRQSVPAVTAHGTSSQAGAATPLEASKRERDEKNVLVAIIGVVGTLFLLLLGLVVVLLWTRKPSGSGTPDTPAANMDSDSPAGANPGSRGRSQPGAPAGAQPDDPDSPAEQTRPGSQGRPGWHGHGHGRGRKHRSDD